MASPVDFAVADVPDRSRLEGRTAPGELVGYIEYRLIEGGWEFLHTVVAPEFQGTGSAPRLTKAAFDLAEELGLRIRPTCPFTAKYVTKHPEVEPLLI